MVEAVDANAEAVDVEAVEAAAEAKAGFLPRFLGAACSGAEVSCSDFLFLPGRDFGTTVGDITWRQTRLASTQIDA